MSRSDGTVGYALHDDACTVQPMAYAGGDPAHLAQLRFSWSAHDPAGQGPVGQCICSGQPVVYPDLQHEQRFLAWRELALQRGYRSVIALPLRNTAGTFGVLGLYGAQAVDPAGDELQLLQDMADNLAFGIGNLRAQADRRRIHAAVLQADARIREQAALLDHARDAILVRGIDGRIQYWNHGAEQLYGWRADEALGHTPAALIYADPTPYHAATAIVLERGEWSGEIRQRHRDGREMVVQGRWTLVRAAAGAPKSILAINTDISERKRAELSLERSLEALRARNAELQDFAFIASHDLQEPLRKVHTFADRLQLRNAAQLDAAGLDTLQRMSAAVRRMQTLIDDLLAYSQVLSPARAFALVDLDLVLAGVLDDLEETLRQFGGTIESGPLPRLHGDASQLGQVLQNLVGNALKYRAAERAPRVRIHAEPALDASAEPAWRILVEDNGIGFAAEHRERIFAPFQRLHGRQEYAGTGIGLAIVRRIVQRHGGSIEAHGWPGQGARFMLVLPQQPRVALLGG